MGGSACDWVCDGLVGGVSVVWFVMVGGLVRVSVAGFDRVDRR